MTTHERRVGTVHLTLAGLLTGSSHDCRFAFTPVLP
jgi:hypothetical protein